MSLGPEARGPAGEAGASPALSRNCNSAKRSQVTCPDLAFRDPRAKGDGMAASDKSHLWQVGFSLSRGPDSGRRPIQRRGG